MKINPIKNIFTYFIFIEIRVTDLQILNLVKENKLQNNIILTIKNELNLTDSSQK